MSGSVQVTMTASHYKTALTVLRLCFMLAVSNMHGHPLNEAICPVQKELAVAPLKPNYRRGMQKISQVGAREHGMPLLPKHSRAVVQLFSQASLPVEIVAPRFTEQAAVAQSMFEPQPEPHSGPFFV